MTNKIPNTPFATRLSGSAKETQLRIRSMFQWKKKRPPVWLFAFIVVVIFGCIGLVSCRREQEGEPNGQTEHTFFSDYRSDFETEPYTGIRDFSQDDRTLMYEDGPENTVESLVAFQYYCQNMFAFDELLKYIGGDSLRLSVENEAKNAVEGMYFEKVILHQMATLTEEDFTPGNAYFSDEDTVHRFLDDLSGQVEQYALKEYTVVYVDLSWQWSERAVELGPQLGDGRYERLYLLGKTEGEDGWKLYECYWGDYVLNRVYSEADAMNALVMRVQITPEGKPLLTEFFETVYHANRAYFLGEEPGEPREGDLRIDSVRFLGSKVTFETTGEAYLVRTSIYNTRMESADSQPITKWWPVERDSYLVLGRGMDGELYEVRGERLDAREGIERLILEESYGISDWEVTLWHDDNPYPQPLALGWWNDMALSLVREEPTIERLEGWEPIHWEGDYWERYTLAGISILRQYSTMAEKNNYVVTTVEMTRDDFSTPRGIKVGSTRADVTAAYPELKSGDYWGKYPGEDYLWYCEDELDFGPALIFFFENDKVSKIVLNNMFN